MVLNKRAGLPVQGGEGVKTSLDSILSESFNPRPLLVHRLDKETSGLILIARTKEAAASFTSLFSGDKGLRKTYLALCRGIPEKAEGEINYDLETKGRKGKPAPKKAGTFYRLIVKLDLTDIPCSLLELKPGSGRMHQLRRHLALIGHPILGDDKYGDFPLNKKLRKELGLKNLMLHAARLVIQSMPCLPDGLDITAPLPPHFESILPSEQTEQ
ncbi:MAG: RNA pseudouridine synthase [Treponema sp.]|nr:RNA pseudouridine synthase [Treponema sp.]